MAASVIACNKFVLITNGKRFICLRESDSVSSQVIDIPDVKGEKAEVKNGSQTEDSDSSVNRILASSVNSDGDLFAVCDDLKCLRIYKHEVDGAGWKEISSRHTARRCTSVKFTSDSSQVVVADKSGDIYSYPVSSQLDTQTGQLKLGHLSMVLDLMLIEDDSLIVTCDRDEKVRISSYPKAYNIHAFCLGHTAFVISLTYDAKQKVIISGSGDCTLRLWTLEGKQLLCHNVLQDLPEQDKLHDSAGTNGKQDIKPENQQAIQQIMFCGPCKLMCVAMTKSPIVLVYRVTSSLLSGVSLTLVHSLTNDGTVVSMSFHNDLLWLLRRETESLSLSAHKVDSKTAAFVKVNPEDKSFEGSILQKVLVEKEFLKVADDVSDMFTHLWKSGMDGYMEEYKERKRQRIEGNLTHSRFGKQKKIHKKS